MYILRMRESFLCLLCLIDVSIIVIRVFGGGGGGFSWRRTKPQL